jgi:hypothetical protein
MWVITLTHSFDYEHEYECDDDYDGTGAADEGQRTKDICGMWKVGGRSILRRFFAVACGTWILVIPCWLLDIHRHPMGSLSLFVAHVAPHLVAHVAVPAGRHCHPSGWPLSRFAGRCLAPRPNLYSKQDRILVRDTFFLEWTQYSLARE